MEIVHFGWDKIIDGKKRDGTDVLPGGVRYHDKGIDDSEQIGFEKTLPVLEILEDSQETCQIGVRVYFETPQEYATFKTDMIAALK